MKHLSIAFITIVVSVLALLGCSPSIAETENITVNEAWVRPAFFEGGTGAAYMTITNNTDTDDRLIGASVDFAGTVELHETSMMSSDSMDDMEDMAMMAPVTDVPVASGETVALESGGLHIMLMDIQEIPEVGETVPVTLMFEEAGEIVVEAEVREEAP